MNYNNDYQSSGFSRENANEKLRPRSPHQVHRLLIIVLSVLAILVVFLASTVIYLLVNNQSSNRNTQSSIPITQVPPTPTDIPPTTSILTDTPTAAASATPVTPSSSTTLTKNLHLTCISYCDSHIDMTLNFIIMDASNNRMEWHFTVKNISADVQKVYANLYLEDPSGKKFTAGSPGTLIEDSTFNLGQTFEEYASFLFLPEKGVNYTMHCSLGGSSGEVFQTEIFTF